jgi:hypothetical protein
MRCEHSRRLPNPAGGAWFCADCGAYPLICTPDSKASDMDCAQIIQRLWREQELLVYAYARYRDPGGTRKIKDLRAEALGLATPDSGDERE